MRVAYLLTVAALVLGGAMPVGARLVNAITAVVHDAPITLDQLRRLMDQTEDELRRSYRTQPELFEQKMEQAREDNMKKLVSEKLILHEFQTAGYSLPESVVDDIVRDRIRLEFGDRQRATRTLQARGLTYEKYRQQQKERYIIQAMRMKNIKSGIIISPFKIETYYLAHQAEYKVHDQVKLKMIELKKSQDSDPEAVRRRAQELATMLKSGAEFAELARSYSDGVTRKDGGDYAWTDRKGLRKELSDVAFAMEVGSTSDVIETPEAFYILKLQEKKAAHVKPLNDVRTEIEALLLTQEQDRLEKQWIDRLRSKTFVIYYP